MIPHGFIPNPDFQVHIQLLTPFLHGLLLLLSRFSHVRLCATP